MIDTNKLKGLIVENEMTQAEMAKELGISPKTFGQKMRKKVFLSNEIEIMIDTLHIENPSAIFFAK